MFLNLFRGVEMQKTQWEKIAEECFCYDDGQIVDCKKDCPIHGINPIKDLKKIMREHELLKSRTKQFTKTL